jgi:hypothetical protein
MKSEVKSRDKSKSKIKTPSGRVEVCSNDKYHVEYNEVSDTLSIRDPETGMYIKKVHVSTYAGGGEVNTWGGIRGGLRIPRLSFSKVDYDVNVNPENFEVDVNIKQADSVDQYALSDTGAEWSQMRWGYMVYPKSVDELYEVLKALKTRVSKKRLEEWSNSGKYAKGGGVGVVSDFVYGDANDFAVQEHKTGVVLKGGFKSESDAEKWAVDNGYIVNRGFDYDYAKGGLVKKSDFTMLGAGLILGGIFAFMKK